MPRFWDSQLLRSFSKRLGLGTAPPSGIEVQDELLQTTINASDIIRRGLIDWPGAAGRVPDQMLSVRLGINTHAGAGNLSDSNDVYSLFTAFPLLPEEYDLYLIWMSLIVTSGSANFGDAMVSMTMDSEAAIDGLGVREFWLAEYTGVTTTFTDFAITTSGAARTYLQAPFPFRIPRHGRIVLQSSATGVMECQLGGLLALYPAGFGSTGTP